MGEKQRARVLEVAFMDAVGGRNMAACRSTCSPLFPGVNVNAFTENALEKGAHGHGSCTEYRVASAWGVLMIVAVCVQQSWSCH